MTPSLLELKVTPSLCFAFKIPDDVTASNVHPFYQLNQGKNLISLQDLVVVDLIDVCLSIFFSLIVGRVFKKICVSQYLRFFSFEICFAKLCKAIFKLFTG